MKIGIDISQIVYGTGVSRYTQELVKNLLNIDKKNQYILFFSSLRSKIQNSKFKIQNYNAKLKNYRIPPTILELLWNKFHMVNVENFVGDIDIFHSSDWTQPPSYAKKITTVHDVSFLRFPESFPKKIIDVHKRRLYWVKKECDLVIADSASTKKDLVDFLGFDEKKIRVINLGVSKKFKIRRDENRIKKDYILSVGTLEPRKNLKSVIAAFAQLKLTKTKLVLVGKKGWGEEIKSLNQNIVFTGFVPEEVLSGLYGGAKCFVYPSLYEGFGLPVLEAMAMGCPVVCSNTSSLPEIAGNAAILVNPTDVNEIAKAIKTILENKNISSQLKEKGLNQAKQFTWEKTARETLEIYKEIVC